MNNIILKHVALFLIALGLMLFAWQETVLHLFNIVWTVDTFSHGVLIPFVSMGLIYLRKDALAQIEPKFWAPGAILLAGASFLWFASHILEIYIVGHIAIVTAVQAIALIIFGPVFYRNMLFPFLFLYLIVPFGDSLLPILQTTTAKMAIFLLDVLGVEFEADGVLITLSSGVYEVARACAGIKFLFTSLVTGILLANLAYKNWKGRLVIIVVSAIIPVFANALRVLGILLISEVTDQSFAKGVDHIVYGWGFLSFVLIILISIAYKFSDVEDTEYKLKTTLPFSVVHAPIYSAGLLLIPLIPVFFAPSAPTEIPVLAKHQMPNCKDCGIRKLPTFAKLKAPLFLGADGNSVATYRILADQIYAYSGVYCPMRTGHRLRQYLSAPVGEGWSLAPDTLTVRQFDANWDFTEAVFWKGNRRRMTWTSFYIGDEPVIGSLGVKLHTAKERFFHGKSAVGIVSFSTDVNGDEQKARANLAKFLSTFSPNTFLWNEIKPQEGNSNTCVA